VIDTQVACPYTVLCFGRCYSGGASLIQLQDVLEGPRRLVVTTSYQLPRTTTGVSKPVEDVGSNSLEKVSKDTASVDDTNEVEEVGTSEPPPAENGESDLSIQELNDSGVRQSIDQDSSTSRSAPEEVENVVAHGS
jgi:hypothetical protein